MVSLNDALVEIRATPLQYNPGGGIARMCRETISGLLRRNEGLQIRLVCQGERPPVVAPHPRLHAIYVDKNGVPKQGRLKRLALRRRKPWREADVVHSFYYDLVPCQGPRVVNVYDLIAREMPMAVPGADKIIPIQRDSLMSADAIISISHATKRAAVDAFGLDERVIRVAHLAASQIFVDAASSEMPSLPLCADGMLRPSGYIVMVTNGEPYKNMAVVIRALALLSSDDPIKLALVVPEGAELSNIRQLAFDLGVESSVLMLSSLSESDIASLYVNSLALVSASFQEGFNLPILEAAVAGAKVIASDISVNNEILGSRGLYFDPRSPVSLARRIKDCRAVSNSGGCSASASLPRDYSWSNYLDVVECVYSSVT